MDKADLMLIVVICLAVFIFDGEPDIYDKLHERAMQYLSVEFK